MDSKEAAKLLVELYGRYEVLSSKAGYSVNQKFSEAVGTAIMSLTNTKD